MVTITFEASLALVLDDIRNIEELHRLARTKITRFAIDACLVAHGVRSAPLHVVPASPHRPTEQAIWWTHFPHPTRSRPLPHS